MIVRSRVHLRLCTANLVQLQRCFFGSLLQPPRTFQGRFAYAPDERPAVAGV